MKLKNVIAGVILFIFLTSNLMAQPGYQPTEKNLLNRGVVSGMLNSDCLFTGECIAKWPEAAIRELPNGS